MGLLSKFRSDRKKGHSRSETSSSSILGSDFSTTASDSSHSSTDTSNFKNYYAQQQKHSSHYQGSSSAAKSLQPQLNTPKSNVQRKPPSEFSVSPEKPHVSLDPKLAPEESASSAAAPYMPRVVTPATQNNATSKLYSPKIRKPDGAKPANQNLGQGPTHSHNKSASYSKSPLSRQHSPEQEPVSGAPVGVHNRQPSEIDTSFSLDPQIDPPSLRTVSQSSFAVTDSVASESDFTSSYEEEDEVSPTDSQQIKLDSQRKFFAQPPPQSFNDQSSRSSQASPSHLDPRHQSDSADDISLASTPSARKSVLLQQQQQQQQQQQSYSNGYGGGAYSVPGTPGGNGAGAGMQYHPQMMQNYMYQQQYHPMQQQQQQQAYYHQQGQHLQQPYYPPPSPSPTERQYQLNSGMRKSSTMLSNLGNSYNTESSDLLSRKSTIRSNRRMSAPISASDGHMLNSHERRASTRMISLDLNKNADNKENAADAGIPHSESGVSLNPNNYRYISDYDKFFNESEADKETQKAAQPSTEESKGGSELERQDSVGSDASYNSIERGDSGKFKVGSKEERLERIKSNTKKFDSTRAEQSKVKMLSEQKKRASTPNFGSLYKTTSSISMQDFGNTTPTSSRMSMMDFGASPQVQPWGLNHSASAQFYNAPHTEYHGSASAQRQSMVMAEAHKRNMAQFPYANIYGHPHHHMMMGGAPQPPPTPSLYAQSRSSSPSRGAGAGSSLRVNDPNILKKIESYVALRNVIAAGNKSLEYRLKWVNMLINSTNARLYNYINIKGEPISPESIPQHRSLFIKSSINHTLKLLRESEKNPDHEEIFSDVCYIYGSLLKNDWVPNYGQDFGIPRDVDEALKHFEKSVEVRANNFKSFYKLGELYEDDLSEVVGIEESTTIALDYYKKSAQYGYNKAIYRISMIYLNVDKHRSHRCIHYLLDLSNIDVNSKDINLEDDDRDELDQVVGMASYQMGKIYEGLYPGDLSPESDFIAKCLERAPVNYSKALTYYNKGAKLHNLDAQVKLGQVYENGELNRQQNPNKSIQWFLKAASSQIPSKRHPHAMLGLSRWYLKGSGGINRIIPYPDPQKALAWCDRAIQSESAEAFFTRGLLAEQGLGIDPPDQFYQRAFELGHFEAGVKLGYNEAQAQSIPPDDAVVGDGLYDFDNQYEIQSPQLSE